MQQTVASPVAREVLIGVRAMARLTGENPSTVSRYVRRYPDLSADVDGATKVRRDAYLSHKNDNPSALVPSVDDEVPAAPLKPAAETQPARAAKARHEEVRAELAEIELAEKKGELVAVEHVRRMIAEAAQRLRNDMLAPQIAFVEQLRAADSARAAATMLVDRNRKFLEEFADRMLAGSGEDEAA